MIKLNLARNCLRYIIRAFNTEEIYLPYYSCPALWQAARKEKIKIRFYHIDSDFLPMVDFPKDSYILYINYFGVCSDNCKILSNIYPNLIVDNTQAFYSNPTGLASFNSLRKFFPVQNGAYLYTDKVLSESFEEDDLVLDYVSPQQDYDKFLKNELLLDREGIKYISSDVEEGMTDIDFEKDKKVRIEKFFEYDKKYSEHNRIKLTPKDGEIPYCYPLSADDNILKVLSKTTVLIRLWEDIPREFPEYGYLKNTVALPLK